MYPSSLMLEIDYIRRRISRTTWIYVAETLACGLGIFSARNFSPLEVIVLGDDDDYYSGALTLKQVTELGFDLSRDCFQIDRNRFLLPTGSIDDLINHCCAPNAGIRLTARGYELIALREVRMHDEITYDYSTYIDSPERLTCHCGRLCCRGHIGRFRDLPAELQAYYLDRGVVGPFAVADEDARRGAQVLETVT